MAFPVGSTSSLITIDNTKVSGSSSLTNFPTLILNSNIPSAVYAAMQGDGDDIRFTSDSAGTTELSFEVVALNAGSETGEFWVKPATITHNADTEIYMWYGDAALSAYAAGDIYGSQAVWTDYGSRFHFESLLADSSAIGATLTNTGGAVQTTGPITQGFQSTTDPKYLNNTANTGIGSTWTMSFLMKLDAEITTDVFAPIQMSDSARYCTFYYEYNGGTRRFRADMAGSGTNIVGNATLGTTQHKIDVVRTADSLGEIYLDGVSIGSGTPTTGAGGYLLRIGTNAAKHTPGIFDEVSLRGDVRNADWLATEYENQINPGTFLTVSDPIAVGGGGLLTMFSGSMAGAI